MKERGRASIILVAGIVSVVAVLVLLFLARANASSAAAQFMTALMKEDADTLASLSYVENKSEAEVKAQWQETIEHTKYFRYGWRIIGERQLSDNTAAVVMNVMKNLGSETAVEEKMELPMIRVDGQWKVSVREIPRAMYPALPR
jgi:hypothetical protein